VVIALIFFALNKNDEPGAYDDFAQCITESGAVMYSAWWCPHCQDQKKLFGNSFQHIDNTECSDPGSKNMNQICKDAGVEGYPTWVFDDGSRESGRLSLEQLSDRTDCQIDGAETIYIENTDQLEVEEEFEVVGDIDEEEPEIDLTEESSDDEIFAE
jgi:hypothetical protein